MPFSPLPPHHSSKLSPLASARRWAEQRGPIWGFVWTMASLVAVTGIKLAAFNYIGPATPFLLYFVSIITAAWFGGWIGGLLVTGVSALLGMIFFMPPYLRIGLHDIATAVRLAVFVLEGIAVTLITARVRGERWRADAAANRMGRAHAQLEGVLRGVTDGITVQSTRGELIYVNEAAANLTGFESAQQMLDASVADIMARFELLDPDGGPFDPRQLPGRLALQGETAPERLVRFRVRATGSERFALVRANAVKLPTPDGPEELVAVNVFHDVTERRRQEDALRVSQEWFATTLASIGDAVIATEADGAVRFMNPLAEQLTGWALSDATGRPLAEVFRIVNEETRQPVESPVDRVLREGKVVGLANHTILLAKDGNEVAIDDSAAPIRGADQRLVGTVLVFRDVSQRRVEEQRRAFITRATAELGASLDYKQTLATVARLAVPAIGDWCAVDILEDGKLHRLAVEHVDPAKVKLVFDLQSRYPADPESKTGLHEVVRSGKPMFWPEIPEQAITAAAKDETHLELLKQLQLRSYLAVPLSANGKVLGAFALAMAESGRKFEPRDLELVTALADRAALAVNHAQLYADADQSRGDALRANRAKDEFLAMLGHELRNPLAPMLTALQLMKLRAPDVLQRERAILERQLKHVVALIQDLLDVSRITSGKIELARETVDLSETLAKALEQTGPLLEDRRHQVVTDIRAGLKVPGDPVRLAQVLSNLISNAAKYTEPGGRIEISAAHDEGNVVVRVRDNGVGLGPELLPRVFDLFVQGGQSMDRAKGGLGLGLAIVRSVVELHGGRVQALSEGFGKGSEFRVVLPAPEMETTSSAVTPPPAQESPHGARILVVDDNEDALMMMGEALTMSGYRVTTATDAASAIAKVRESRPDVALLDIGLPLIDGYELARRLREDVGLVDLKLVALTGYGQPADKTRAIEAGFDEHMVKPISVEQLQAVLARLTSPTA